MSASADKKSVKRGTPKRSKTVGRTSSLLYTGKNKKKKTKKVRAVSKKEFSDTLHWLITIVTISLVSFGAYWFLIRPYSYRWKPCYGSKEYGICLPLGYSVYGIDVSHHQGKIDWNMVRSSSNSEYPLSFAVIKATEGGSFKDDNYDNNIDSARQSGLICGSYHFYNPGTSPEKQAEFFFDNVKLLKGDLPPIVDVESRGDDIDTFQKELLTWLQLVEKHYGIKPFIYTSVKFKNRYLNTPDFDRYPLWVAHYYVEKPDIESKWMIWQCSDRGRVEGINVFTDINVYSGSLSDLRSLLY